MSFKFCLHKNTISHMYDTIILIDSNTINQIEHIGTVSQSFDDNSIAEMNIFYHTYTKNLMSFITNECNCKQNKNALKTQQHIYVSKLKTLQQISNVMLLLILVFISSIINLHSLSPSPVKAFIIICK